MKSKTRRLNVGNDEGFISPRTFPCWFNEKPAEIDAKLLNDLEDLKKRTKVSKRALVEQAVRLLIGQYRTIAAVYKNGAVDNLFLLMVDETMKQYDQTMKNLRRS